MSIVDPVGEVSRRRLLSFVDSDVMQGILEAFTETTKLMANIVDINGRSIFSRESFNKCCSFCKLIYGMDGGLDRCRNAYKRSGKQAAVFGEPYIFRCPSGLIEWASPIIVEGQHIGTVICGQVLMWEPEDFFWIELRELNKNLTNDFTELFAEVKKLPVVSPSTVRSASYLLHMIANYIMKSGWNNYVHSKEITYQQSLLYKEIESRENLEKELTGKTAEYSFANEQELIMKIKLGEVEAANDLLQKLLADIVLSNERNLSHIQTNIVELCVLISRSALDAGIDVTQTTSKNTQVFKDIFDQGTVEEVCLQAQKHLNYCLECIREKQKQPSNLKVQEIIRIIRRDYQTDLTLEKIADCVYLSPSYASRLFKKVQHCSIMEYLTKVRVEEAKYLLRNPNYLIDDVSTRVGYSDAGYFTRVFRRLEGLTPTQYRNMQQKS